MTRKQKYRRVLLVFLFFNIMILGFCGFYTLKKQIPDEIKILANEVQQFNFSLPAEGEIYKESKAVSGSEESNIPADKLHLSLNEPFTFVSGNAGNYAMDCKLFGMIPLKSVSVQVVNKQTVTPCGMPIGIYMETDGVLVIGTGNVAGIDGQNHEPAYQIVQSGDYIEEVNGTKVANKEQMISKVNECGGEQVILKLRRKGESIQVKVDPVQTTVKEYKLGIWVRDNVQGIGTMTYMTGDNHYGALGHAINDSDTGTLMEIKAGTLYETQILSIVKGQAGTPGGMEGVIQYADAYKLGTIDKNTTAGIYGTVNKTDEIDTVSKPLPIALKQDIKKGKATILSCVDGFIKEYEIKIKDVNLVADNVNKGIEIEVTDKKLLSLTGGIVQGMSGSPIIQDGKIIGAVTHVFVKDSTKGYGIFIENMLETN